MKQTLIMMKGIQGSGKSTWAKEFVKNNRAVIRVSNDDLRLMFFNRQFDERDTKFINYYRELIINDALEDGSSVIVDAMNLSSKHEDIYRAKAESYGCEFEIKSFLDVPLEVCIQRDSKRENPIGKKLITKMYNQFVRKEPPKIIFDPKLPYAVWSDLDGTLSKMIDRSPYQEEKCESDLVNESVRETIIRYHMAGYKIILCSGRDEGRGREATERWLEKYNIPYDYLFMRSVGDQRKDTIVKKEFYENRIKGNFNLLFCMDDRDCVVSMLRGIGLSVFQVNEGDF
jgi:predicted kinase